jgi:regulator of sigma E protease
MLGVPTPVEETAAGPEAQLYVVSVLPESPLSGNLTPGAEIVAVRAGETVLTQLTPSAFTNFVQANSDRELALTIKAGESERVVTVTPQAGLIAADPSRKAAGIGLALVEYQQENFFTALGSATVATGRGLLAITTGIGTLLSGLISGEADLSQVAGPVGIAGMVGDAATLGLVSLFSFIAVISLNLAVINLLPFPALDGGRLLILMGEVVFRRPANQIWVTRLNAAGFVLLLVFMVVVTYNDILRLF